MHRFIRTCLPVLAIVCSQNLFATVGSPRPLSTLPVSFLGTVRKLESSVDLSALAGERIYKICSCQIMDLQSNNYRDRNVAVFAEQTVKGNPSSGFAGTTQTIEKEKKHLKSFFYDKLKVLNRVSATTDCRTLYIKLKAVDRSLIIYDILDANAQPK